MIDKIIDFFLPKWCVVCGRLETDLCKECEAELGLSSQICPVCEEESVMGWTHEKCKKSLGMDGLIALFEYGDPGVRAVVDGIKYEFNKSLVGKIFGKMKVETGVVFDYLVPVPLHFYRQNWRGFNQAELVAVELQKQIEGKVTSLLKRKINTKQQALMISRKEREENVRDAFGVVETLKTDLVGKKVLLVDDVFTTGSSMKACCSELKKNGAVLVWGFVLAH